jgi:CubicO group peptidase (beta-lactamase class C family)
MEKEVFSPLGMPETFFGVHNAEERRSARPHNIDVISGKTVERPAETWADCVAPAGAAWSTVNDMTKYIIMELNNGITSTGEHFMSEAMIEDRRTPRVPVDPVTIGPASLFPCTEYCICLFKNKCTKTNLTYYHHGGNTLGFSSQMAFFPEEGFGLVILTNMAFAMFFTEAISAKIIQLMIPGVEVDPEGYLTAAKVFNDAQKSVIDSLSSESVETLLEPFFSNKALILENCTLGKIILSRDEAGVWFKIGPNRLRVARLKDEESHVIAICPWLQFNDIKFKVDNIGLSLSAVYEQKSYIFQ